MTKPSKLPEWDTTQVNSIEPDATHKAQGWLQPGGVPEKPPMEYFNYWQNEVYRWLSYLSSTQKNSILELINLSPANGDVCVVSGFYGFGDSEERLYVYDSSQDKSTANGGTIIDPDNIGTWNGTASQLASQYYGPGGQGTGIGLGCWVLNNANMINGNFFGAIGDSTVPHADMLAACEAVWGVALSESKDFYFPAGLYEIGDNSFPWRQQVVTTLLDCGNITLYCDGPATIFKTTSSAGADVFQLNGMKNFHVKGFPTLTAELLLTTGSGSNGCSVTNGFDNITLEITPINCQSIDKTTYIDGGKGLTIQTPTPGQIIEVGTLSAIVHANGCAEGVGFEVDLVAASTKKTAIDVNLIAENCYTAIKFVAPQATGAIAEGVGNGYRVRGQAINCQKDIAINRCHGADIDCQVITTKSAAARRLDPQSVAWFAADAIVETLYCVYAKNTIIKIYGNKGSCDYKARIGGTTAGSSGLSGSSEFCNFYIDIGGTAAVDDIISVVSGGDTMNTSMLFVTPVTTIDAFPAEFLLTSNNNTLVNGASIREIAPIFADHIKMAFAADGITETGRVDLFGNITGLQGKAVSAAGSVVAGLYDSAGNFRLGCMNQNGLVIDSVTTASAIGAYVGKYATYDKDGIFIGYIPLYA